MKRINDNLTRRQVKQVKVNIALGVAEDYKQAIQRNWIVLSISNLKGL